ncbi:MAG TPA: Uma2 family endonuclease [Aggregatilineaceae bacterium]|nr:Uma2 family endonuclease [Aggregatilineaceae bacterium]
MVAVQNYTVEEFEHFVMLPENAGKNFEFIGGEIVEIIPNSYSSQVAMQIGAQITLYVNKHCLGFVTGADGGYMIGGERYIPDVGFISKAKQSQPPHDTYIPDAPDLAVEVISPTDQPRPTRIKIIKYLEAGTIVWVVDPETKTVEVYTPGPQVNTLDLSGTLDGGAILPGFTLPVQDIFPE